MDTLSIKIKIDNREYPIQVTPKDEERLRRAGKLINEKIDQFKSQFGIEDKQDILSMVLFKSFVEKLELEEEFNNRTASIMTKLNDLDHLISENV